MNLNQSANCYWPVVAMGSLHLNAYQHTTSFTEKVSLQSKCGRTKQVPSYRADLPPSKLLIPSWPGHKRFMHWLLRVALF